MTLKNVYDLVGQHRHKRSGKTAIVDGEVECSFAFLISKIDAIADQLKKHGVRAGDRVAIHLNKGIEEVVAFFAIAKISAVSVNINYRWVSHQCVFVLDDCGVTTLITDKRKAYSLFSDSQPKSLDSVVTIENDELSLMEWGKVPSGRAIDTFQNKVQSLATILYTSGSTGMPKGVMLTHETIIKGAEIVSTYLKNTFDDRILSLVPLSFDYGLNQLTSMCFIGGTVVLQKTAMTSAIVETIQQKKVTGLAAVPSTWIEIVTFLDQREASLPTLRYITNTGGKIPQTILIKLGKIFHKVDKYLMYGFTEAFRSTYLPPDKFNEKCGSIGIAIPGVEVFVVDSEKGICADNEVGELIHSGALISSGYWNRLKETREKIKVCPHLSALVKDQPVAYSGDLVKRDSDGFIWFVGRMDDMIKSSGYRISPTEVEEIIYASGIVQCAVAYGVEDHRRGQVVHAGVSPGTPDFCIESLSSYCKKNMPSYMIPTTIHNWQGEMPKTSNGKIDRKSVINKLVNRT